MLGLADTNDSTCMRVLQVTSFHAKVGGAEVYVHQLCAALEQRGHVVGFFGCDPEHERDEPGLRVVRRPAFDPATVFEDPPLTAAFRAFATRFAPDIVHVHNLYNLPAAFGRVLAEVGVPILQHPHDFGLVCTNAWCVLPDGRMCEGGPGAKCSERGCSANYPFDARIVGAARLRMLLARETAAAFVSGSEALAEVLRSNGLEPSRCVRYFAEPEKFGGLAALARLRAEVPRARDQILFVGRLEPEKGVGVLVRALPRILSERPAARLHIVGDGTLGPALRAEAAALGVAEAVVWHGRIPHEDVPRHLARATVQVLPSIWAENAAQSCYDCLLAELPMVASRVGALPEVVRDGVNGLLAAPRDPEDFARKILAILGDDALAARLSASCRAELVRYDKQAHLEAIEALYAEMRATLAGGARAPARIDGDMLHALDGLARDLARREHEVAENHVALTETHAALAEAHERLRTRRDWRDGGRLRRWLNGALDRVFGAPR
jgi:glycosyltransferase involved in cell wall biosynthesis